MTERAAYGVPGTRTSVLRHPNIGAAVGVIFGALMVTLALWVAP